MKFLSFNYKDAESYGVKVKREDAVWDLKRYLRNLEKVTSTSNIIRGITTKPNTRFPRTST